MADHEITLENMAGYCRTVTRGHVKLVDANIFASPPRCPRMVNAPINFDPSCGIHYSVEPWSMRMLHHFFASSHDPFWVNVLLIFSLAVAVEGQSSCVPRPISIPIGNVSVANSRNKAVARGIAIDIGNPPQSFAFLPDA